LGAGWVTDFTTPFTGWIHEKNRHLWFQVFYQYYSTDCSSWCII
jgi:hypothetical protein